MSVETVESEQAFAGGAWAAVPVRDGFGFGCVRMGGLPLVRQTRQEAARFIDRAAAERRDTGQRPLYITSANGEVLARVAREPALGALFRQADMIHADGQAMVVASRVHHAQPLPERVATTDLFHDVAALAERSRTSFYLLGGTAAVNAATVSAVRQRYPGLLITGARNGYMRPAEEAAVVREIARARPGVLWVAMGVPHEQAFVVRHRAALEGVGVIKTAGGLFDFLSGRRSRAPLWMQRAGLEWLYRVGLEPARLGPRYLCTNPLALRIMLAKPDGLSSRSQSPQAQALVP